MRFRCIAAGLAILSAGLLLCPADLLSRSLPDQTAASIGIPSDSLAIHYPRYWGIIHTGKLDASFNCDGTFGYEMGAGSDGFRPDFSFAMPAGSNVDYLFGGAFWIGGIRNYRDTVVTTSFDGWENISETEPTDRRHGTMTTTWSALGSTLRCEFVDTGVSIIDHPHFPLGLKGTLRATWSDTVPAAKKTILFDLIITNIQGRYIHRAFVGLYFDPDIYLRTGETNTSGISDDLCGSFRSNGLAYAIDGGRETIDGQFVDTLSPMGAFGLKLLGTWPPMPDTNFNWWASSASSHCDFGPRQRGTFDDPYRDFQTGSTGTPTGDRNKYYMLSHEEWDYDAYLTASIGDSNETWMPPFTSDIIIECQKDFRFLLSVGPFELPPDSSVRFVFAMLAGDSVHGDPLNYRDNMQMNYRPDSFYAKLNFNDLLRSGAVADSLVQKLLDPLQPVTGLSEEPKRGDTVTISWDPWVFDTVTGYDIYMTPISPDSLPYPGVAAPWLKPSSPNCVATNIAGRKFWTDTLTPHTIYAVSVANRTSAAVGPVCDPIFVQRGPRLPSPTPDKPFRFAKDNDSVVISWQPPTDVEVDHYCVYKFNSEVAVGSAYHAYYDSVHLPTDPVPVDTFDINGRRYYYLAMTPVSVLDSSETRYIEPHCSDSAAYVISAVDRYGFETEFTEPVVTYTVDSPNRDIIVLTRATDAAAVGDSILAFYNTLLQGYDFKIFNLALSDSANGGGRTDIHTYGPFRLLILDGNLADQYIGGTTFDSTPRVVTQYLATGGRVAYFGQFRTSVTGDKFNTYPVLSDYVAQTFGLESISSFYLLSYVIKGINGLDTLTGFTNAQSVNAGYPNLEYDTSRYTLKPGFESVWPQFLAPQTASFVPNQHGEVTHLFRSYYPGSSLQEGEPVGIHTEVYGTETWAFGFHLWYMRYDQARQLIDAIMQRIPTGVDDDDKGNLPRKMTLSQNYPNPFNPSTTIEYSVPSKSNVRLEIFNILGQQIRTLVDEPKAAGEFRIVWNGQDERGRPVSTGIYLYRLRVGDAVLCKKMLLLK